MRPEAASPRPEISADNGRADTRRTFKIHDGGKHGNNRAPPQRPTVAAPHGFSPSPSPSSVYYFKPVDSSPKPTASVDSHSYSMRHHLQDEDDNLALPQDFQPTYIVYPPASNPTSSPSSSQSYLKPSSSVVQKTTFRPAGSYDAEAAASNSIYREETSNFHAGNLVHLPQVMMQQF